MALATDEVSILREHFARFRGVTLQTLDLVPDDKLSWRPAEGLRSFADVFLHIAQAQDFYIRGFFVSDWNFSRLKPPAEPLGRALLRERLDQAQAITLEKLNAVDPGWLDYLVPVPNVPVQWPLRGWLWYLVEHEVHHKAQLALYLRQIGVLPPFFASVMPPGMRPDIR